MLTTLPNLLTFSRIVAIPLVVITFYVPAPEGPWIGCFLFALAAFTDWLDGKLARLWQQQSELGRFLDPIADKLLVAAILFMLGALKLRQEPPPGTLALTSFFILPALVILSREILVSGLREYLADLRVRLPVSRVGRGLNAVSSGLLCPVFGPWLSCFRPEDRTHNKPLETLRALTSPPSRRCTSLQRPSS